MFPKNWDFFYIITVAYITSIVISFSKFNINMGLNLVCGSYSNFVNWPNNEWPSNIFPHSSPKSSLASGSIFNCHGYLASFNLEYVHKLFAFFFTTQIFWKIYFPSSTLKIYYYYFSWLDPGYVFSFSTRILHG